MPGGTSIQKLELEWTVESPLKIGPEGKSPDYDIPIIKIIIDGKEVPYIPGSSIKGVLRSAVEQLLPMHNIKVCNILEPKKSCGGRNASEIRKRQKRGNGNLNEIIDRFCLACKLFGSHYYRGRVRITDAYPVMENLKPVVGTGERPGIAIDRVHGSVVDGSLFNIEYVSIGSKFRSTIKCEDISEEMFALLLIVLFKFNKKLLRLGGLTSKGFGIVRVRVTRFENYRVGFDNRKPLFEIEGVPNNSEGDILTGKLEEWANKTWNLFLENNKKYKQKTSSSGHDEAPLESGRECDDEQYDRLEVIKVARTKRNVIDPHNSGIITGYLILLPGYYLHVGSGVTRYLAPANQEEIFEIIQKASSADDAFSKVKLHIGNMKLFEVHAYQIIVNGKSRIVIPGSTLKGLFRSRMELAFNPCGGEIPSCLIKSEEYPENPSRIHREIYGINGYIPFRERCDNIDRPCIVCDVFGMTSENGGLRALIDVSDAVLRKGTPKIKDIKIGNGGTAYLQLLEGSKEEENKVIFRYTIRYRNLDSIRLGLLFNALGVFGSKRLRIGHFKYREYAEEELPFGLMESVIFNVQMDDGTLIENKGMNEFIAGLKEKVRKYYGKHLRVLREVL